MRVSIVIAFLSIINFGCQSQSKSRQYWLKSDTTLEQAIMDCKKCRESAHGDAQAGHYDRYRARMENNHATPYNEELDRADRDADDLFSFRNCMRKLGYRPVSEGHLGAEIRKTHRFGGNDIQYIAGK